MFKTLSRLFGSKPKAPRLSLPVTGAVTARTAPVRPSAPPPPPAPPSAKDKWMQDAAKSLSREASPEELCGITPGMSAEQLRERLAMLYQRHNRAASSLDPKLREDAEFMLETLTGLRDKYFSGPVAS